MKIIYYIEKDYRKKNLYSDT